MKRRLLSLFLALTLLLSLCAPTAWALEPTSEQIKFVIDLTGYTGEVDNTLQYKPSGSTSYSGKVDRACQRPGRLGRLSREG